MSDCFSFSEKEVPWQVDLNLLRNEQIFAWDLWSIISEDKGLEAILPK